MFPVEFPFKTYAGLDGLPLQNGYVYFGQPGQNPVTAPVTVYWDAAGTQPAAQPLRTVNGYIVRAGAPSNVFFDGAYSELVKDSAGSQVFYARTSDEFNSLMAFIATFASSLGASLIGFIQAGIGALLRTVQAKLRDFPVSPEDFGGIGDGLTDDTAAVLAAHATGRTVDLGGIENVWKISTGIVQLPGQATIASGATLYTTANITLLTPADDSIYSGINFKGDGKDTGKTLQYGVNLEGNGSFVGPTRTRGANCSFLNFGGDGVHLGNIVENHQGNLLMGFTYQACNTGLNVGERGEYTQIQGGSATLCNTGVRVCGGNTNLGGMTISDNTIGVLLDAGDNDSHGHVTGCSINHNTWNVKANAITSKSFAFNGGSIYAGAIWLNHCEGVRFVGTDLASIVIYEEGCQDCYFHVCNFRDDPTITPNYNGAPSEVFYMDCIWPQALPETTSKRINGAISIVQQTGAAPVIATGTTHDFVFPVVVFNALSSNTSYTLATLYSIASKYWDYTVLKTPRSDWFADIGVNLTIGNTAGAFDDTKVDVYLWDTAINERQATLVKGIDVTSGAAHYRVYSFFGRVRKGKIGIRIVNNTGGNISVYSDTVGTPTNARASGF